MIIFKLTVDGDWSDWSQFSDCSTSCGGGERVRTRSCDNPVPEFGGADCVGRDTRIRECAFVIACPGWCFKTLQML